MLYVVQLTDGSVLRRHVDQFHTRHKVELPGIPEIVDFGPSTPLTNTSSRMVPSAIASTSSTNQTQPLRCSSRITKPVDHFTPVVSIYRGRNVVN